MDKNARLQLFVELIGQTVSNENSDSKDADNTIVTNLVKGSGKITEFVSEEGITLKTNHLSHLDDLPKKLYALIEMDDKKIIKIPASSLLPSKKNDKEEESTNLKAAN